MKLTKSQLKEMIREELKLREAKKPAQLIKSKGSGRFSGNYVFVKNTDVGYMYQQAGRSGKPLKSGNTQYFTFKHYKDEVEKGKNYDIVREELKLTEVKHEKWVVWIGQGSSRNRKLMKVAKSRRAALIYYNKLVNSDKYDELGMESAEHWNRTNSPKVQEGKLNEDDFASKYADMIDEIKEKVMFKSTNIVMMLNNQDKIAGTKNAKAYNKLIDTHFRKFIIGAKKIQKMIKD